MHKHLCSMRCKQCICKKGMLKKQDEKEERKWGERKNEKRGNLKEKSFVPHGKKYTRNSVRERVLYDSYGIDAVPFTEER